MRVLAALLLAFTMSAEAAAQTMPFGSDIFGAPAAEPIGDGIYSFRSGAYRTMFMTTPDGVILVDPMGDKNAALVDEAIKKLTDKPVRFVVYSQSHRDRAGGAKRFTARGAKVVAHEGCADALKRTPFPEVVPPDISFSDTYSIKLGGRGMDLYYFGPANDTCAIVAVPRPGDVVFIVNVVIPPGPSLPWNMTLADTHVWNLPNFMKRVEEMAAREGVTKVAGSFISTTRGPDGKPVLASGAGPISIVADQRAFWEMLFADVKAAMATGVRSDDVGTKIDHEKYKKFRRYDEKALNVVARRVASMYTTGR